MNLTLLFHRLEIAFWTAWVAALQNPQARRMALAVALLVPAALIIAVLSSQVLTFEPAAGAAASAAPMSIQSAASLPESPTAGAQNTAAAFPGETSGAPANDAAAPAHGGPTARPSNGQSNLLVVVVNELEASAPRLHGVWLLARLPALSQVTFMPIYPSIQPAGRSFNARLEAAYRPTRREPLPGEFRRTLEAQGLWWDHYLVVDEAGLGELYDLAGSFDGETGDAAALQPTSPAVDPQAALAYQSQVARQVCAHSTQWAVGSAPVVVTTLFTEQTLTDLKAEDLRLTLRSLRASEGIACQFPILTGR